MKTILKIHLFTLVIAMSFAVNAGEVTDTFTAGDTLTATKMTNIKDAINDNNLTKQQRVTGACGAGYAIQSINADGTVVCELDDDAGGDIQEVIAGAGLSGGGATGAVTLRRASGTVTVSPASFRAIISNGCESRAGVTFYWDTSSTTTNCTAGAGVSLPDGATLTGLSCWGYDNDASGSNSFSLTAALLNGSATAVVFQTPTSVDSASRQELSDTTTGFPAVTNSAYSYTLYWDGNHDTSTVDSWASFYSCTISYTF